MSKKKDKDTEPQQERETQLTNDARQTNDTSLSDALRRMKQQASESDEKPASTLRFRDILGGDVLWSLVKHQAWLIILVVIITTAYVAVRYQCQQDAIDISRLEKKLVDAKYEALSSSSNLTRICRQGNVIDMLNREDTTRLRTSPPPPFIIEVPQQEN